MVGINGFVLVSLLCFLIFLLSIHNLVTNYEDNRCNMTYMYEYPQFVSISLPANVTYRYKRYGLHAYGEGRFIDHVRSMRFSGIPVLFVPGNRGSHRQVRSIASVSLRKAISLKTFYHFDYFGVDFNEEYSALYGGKLEDQTEFTNICIDRILSLYKGRNVPSSVVLVGHSMGGLVIKGLFLNSQFDTKKVKIVITLATPHAPAILMDQHLNEFYHKVESFWDNNWKFRKDLVFVSVGGGPRDLMVKSSLALTKHADISITACAVPDVWMSTDHLCILWCKELVKVVVRSLFDSVDLLTRQISSDSDLLKAVFKYHFTDRSAGKRYQTSLHPAQVTLWNGATNPGVWLNLEKNQWTWSSSDLRIATHIVISLATAFDTLALQTLNHETKDWIFACKSQSSLNGVRVCQTGDNLSAKARISPSNGYKRKSVALNLAKLRMSGYTHVVVRTLRNDDFVSISFDLFKMKERQFKSHAYYLWPTSLTSQTIPGALYYHVELLHMAQPWHNYNILLESSNCTPADGHVTVKVPWSNEGTSVLTRSSFERIPVKIYSSKPSLTDIKSVQVELFTDPKCSYSLRVEKPILSSLGSLAEKSAVTIPAYIAVCLLLTLSVQVVALHETGNCPMLHSALPSAAKPYYILPAASIASTVARKLPMMIPFMPGADLPSPQGIMENLVIPFFLHCTAFAICYIIGAFILVGCVFYGQAYNNVLLRFLNKFCLGLPWLSEWVIGGMSKVPLIVSALMMSLSYTACSGLALCIGCSFYFLKLVSHYEDFWEEIIYWPLKVIKAWIVRRKNPDHEYPTFEFPSVKDISYHLTLFMMWLMITIINVPSVLVWAKNFRYETKLDPDPFFVNGMVLSLSAGILWQSEVPKVSLEYSKDLGQLLRGCAVLCLVYSQTSWHRLATLLTGTFVVCTLHQVLIPWFIPVEENADSNTNEHKETPATFMKFLSKVVFSSAFNFYRNLGSKLKEDEPQQTDEVKPMEEDGSEHGTSPSGSSSENEDDCKAMKEDLKSGVTDLSPTEGDFTQSDVSSSSSFEKISLSETKSQ